MESYWTPNLTKPERQSTGATTQFTLLQCQTWPIFQHVHQAFVVGSVMFSEHLEFARDATQARDSRVVLLSVVTNEWGTQLFQKARRTDIAWFKNGFEKLL